MQTLIMIVGIVIILGLFWQGTALNIMPVPTLPGARRKALALMPKDARTIIELGAGWGGMTRRIRKAFPHATVIAYERSLIPWAVSRLSGPTVRGDIFKADFRQADVIFCYLSPWHMEQLASKFAAELKPGAVVVSVAFPIRSRTPTAVDAPVYLYRFGE